MLRVPAAVGDATKHRGFAFITFKKGSSAAMAVKQYHDKILEGYKIRVIRKKPLNEYLKEKEDALQPNKEETDKDEESEQQDDAMETEENDDQEQKSGGEEEATVTEEKPKKTKASNDDGVINYDSYFGENYDDVAMPDEDYVDNVSDNDSDDEQADDESEEELPKPVQKKRVRDPSKPEDLSRTIFVRNLPLDVDKVALENLYDHNATHTIVQVQGTIWRCCLCCHCEE